MLAITTKRPRNVDSPRAAAILYGDWGTSKALMLSVWPLPLVVTVLSGSSPLGCARRHCNDGPGGCELHGHLPPLSRRLAWGLRQCPPSLGNCFHRRRVPVDCGLHRHRRPERAVRLSISRQVSWTPSRGVLGGGRNYLHWLAELFRTKTHRRPRVSGFPAHRRRRGFAGRILPAAPW